tara:strand:+ start:665 stop:958 length:294 start_codon:yes stop_codon:yes gene_type:complete
MLTTSLILFILYLLFLWISSWIRYFNKLDERFGNSIWRYSYDYHVVGEKDYSFLDDKNFVLLRRKRNSIITVMYFIVFIAFIFLMSLMGDILLKIMN